MHSQFVRQNILVALFLGLIASACVQTTIKPGPGAGNRAIEKSGTALVSVPKDGRYGATVYSGSGAMTAQIVGAAFATVLSRVEIEQSQTNLDQSLAEARNRGFKYLISPQILHWEDRATEWSGISDKASVKITIYEASSGVIVNSGVIDGKSAWFTFGGDHPQDLLPKPAREYATSVVK